MKRVGSVSLVVEVFLALIITSVFVVMSETDTQDVSALNSLKASWQNVPPTWNNFGDPCSNQWEGIVCNNFRVVSISLSSMGLKGTLSGDIEGLSELKTLDLSYNKGLSEPLPAGIGKLSKLTNLILIGCSFSGKLPDSIGSLSQLVFLSLNSNSFSGKIPNSFGNLSSLYWLDLADNKLTGSIPVSNGTTPGLDMLVNTKHFHFDKNQLSGAIPAQLFNENMKLIHIVFDNNQLTGNIPTTLGLVQSLEVLRLDHNSLSGTVPSNINNLTSITDLQLSNNGLTGPMPDLTGMNSLSYLDMSNNSFEPSDVPSWFTGLLSLTTLMMASTQLQGTIPVTLFSIPQLQTVELMKNNINGTLDLGGEHSSQLTLVDLQHNNISVYSTRHEKSSLRLILAENPVCVNESEKYCILQHQLDISSSYTTPPQNCVPTLCSANEIPSPNCKCSYPYVGTLSFRSTKFSNLQNITYYTALEQKLLNSSRTLQMPVDSVSLSNISRDSSNNLKMTLEIFPLGQDRFNRTGIYSVGFMLSNQTFKPPPLFYGPYFFIGNEYTSFADEPLPKGPKATLSTGSIVGIAVGASAFLLILFCIGAFTLCRKKRAAETAQPANPSGFVSSTSWMTPGSNTSNLKMKASKMFSFEDIKNVTNNFSEANQIGSGSYGKVYRGTLGNGQLIAVKRAEQRSGKGGLEFNTEVELLSRVHHKNLVTLFGFCFENEELILVYEYVPNGTLNQCLSGKSGIRLDWRRRINVAVGAARGLAYLHELADPPIIHRDIKSSNILLDENLNAKVSDFGLSRPLFDVGKGHIITEVKGTLGYLDPEYYMTQMLTEKSDVYSFGILMLEIITGRPPIDNGKYILRQVKEIIDRTQGLYGLQELLDPIIVLETTLKGFEKYVDLALRCVEESRANRPAMGEVVKQLDDILEMTGMNPHSDSATSSATFVHGNLQHLYGDESLYNHSGALPR